jgi:hypothetical protein
MTATEVIDAIIGAAISVRRGLGPGHPINVGFEVLRSGIRYRGNSFRG